jgi:predicted RNA binding protein YcfA (HicA-like mRNA interferase family)
MKIPRDINGLELVKYLKPYGYIITRQTGSHIRLTTQLNGEHHITVPNHKPLKIGTLSSIIADIANHFNSTKEDLLHELFGK